MTRRTWADSLRGLGWGIAFLVLLAAPPVALLRLGTVPSGLPQVEWPPSSTVVLSVATAAAWILWATFAVVQLVDLWAILRSRPLPELGWAPESLRFVTNRVATGMTMIVAILHPAAAASAAPLSSAHVAVAPGSGMMAFQPAQQVQRAAPNLSGFLPPAGGKYVVAAAGDTLWDLAARHLGNPFRHTELESLNRGLPQPDGRALVDADWIEPGWVIRLPDDAVDGHVVPSVRSGADDEGVQGCETDVVDAGESGGEGADTSPPTEPTPSSPTTVAESGPRSPSPASPPIHTARPDGGAEPRPPVTLPSGASVGAAFAAGIATSWTVQRIHRRRGYRPKPPVPGRVARQSAPEPIPTMVAATSQAAGPGNDEDHDDARGAAGRTSGTERTTVVEPDLLELGGLRIDGDGAEDVARSILLSALVTTPQEAEVLVDRAEARALLGDNLGLPGLNAVADDVLGAAEVEQARRFRVLDAADVEDFREYRASPRDEHLPLLIAVQPTDDEDEHRWEQIATRGPRLGIVVLSIGHAGRDGFPRLMVGGDGRVNRVEGAVPGVREGVSLPRLTRGDAEVVVAQLATTTHVAASPGADDTTVEEPFVFDALPPESGAPSDPEPPIKVRLFGEMTIDGPDGIVRGGMREKARELLARLLLQPEGVRREVLMEELWPDVELAKRQDRFSAAVSSIRTRLRAALGSSEHEVVICDGDLYRVDGALFDVDYWRFQSALRVAATVDDREDRESALESALELYHGDLGATEFWSWAEDEREALRRRALDAAVQLAEWAEGGGRLDDAIVAVERAISIDPYAEELYVRGVRLLVAAGRTESGVQLYRQLRQRLDQLDVDPMESTSKAIAQILGDAGRVRNTRAAHHVRP